MFRYLCRLCGLCLLLITATAQAKYAMPQLLEVPIDRVNANLEQQLARAEHSGDARLILYARYSLARIQAMRYAYSQMTVKVYKNGYPQTVQLFDGFGHYTPAAPGVLPPADRKAGLDSLHRAIANYRLILASRPDDRIARLGLGWCLQQDGKRDEARAIYRRLIDDTMAKIAKLPKDPNVRPSQPLGVDVFDTQLAVEASSYLTQLYQQANDQRALRTLQKQTLKLTQAQDYLRGYMPITPIAIPLRDNLQPAQMIDHKARVRFDLDGRGRQCWRWLNNNAAWLVYRQPGAETISSGRQLFGAITFSMFWDNGYQALATLDDNGDGQLNSDELRGLALWHDANRNGVAEPDEVKPLADYDIVALHLGQRPLTGQKDAVAKVSNGVLYRDGSTRDSYDLLLRTCDGKTPAAAGVKD